MNVYVWSEFCPDYSDGLAVVIADSLEEAIETLMIKLEFDGHWDPDTGWDTEEEWRKFNWGPVTVHEYLPQFAAYVFGGA